ncbi:lipase member M-like [Dermacentor albipictus]|uniref:lipase member M-like n=1 Tax=Dermacentor albipictus TaxID=60249 RepID=UPI0038FCE765
MHVLLRQQAELVRSKGYPAEEHVTVTEDGYVLSLQRVPRGARQLPGPFTGPPVLLVHGLLSSAAVWVLNYPHQSLGFLLADAGYDVWLGNYRGTPYSRGHLEFSDSNSRYWDFSLDEVGLLDLPALVDYVLDHTGWPQLFLVGFSQGSAAAWAMLADKPHYNNKASAIVANQGRLLVRPQWLRRATYAMCESPLRYVCALPTFFFFGVNLNQLNQMRLLMAWVQYCNKLTTHAYELLHLHPEHWTETERKYLGGERETQSRLAVYTSHLPSGASKRNVEQFAQVDSPAYDFSKIRAPVALFSAHKDFFANPDDVSTLRQSLPNVVLDYIVPDLEFSHMDFILGTEAAAFVYRPLIYFMDYWVLLYGP